MKKNSLERILLMAEKAVKSLAEEAAKGHIPPGIKFDKDTEYETRMRWVTAVAGIREIVAYYRGHKALIGTCHQCKYYVGSNSGWGVCGEGTGRVETQHIYDSCAKFKEV